MKKLYILFFFSPFICLSQSIFDDFDKFLKDHAVFGAVDYSAIKQNPTDLNQIINKISSHSLEDVTEESKKAFYINAYNILVIYQVVQNYPIKSPMDVEGFFKVNTFTIAGEDLTLDEIEFNRLLKDNLDPRIHFALACAAKGCPYLYENAYFPEKIEEQLNFRAKQITRLSNYVYVDVDKKYVEVSKIFEWYQDQFLSVAETLIGYINMYRDDKIPASYTVKYRDYDWSLNDR